MSGCLYINEMYIGKVIGVYEKAPEPEVKVIVDFGADNGSSVICDIAKIPQSESVQVLVTNQDFHNQDLKDQAKVIYLANLRFVSYEGNFISADPSVEQKGILKFSV